MIALALGTTVLIKMGRTRYTWCTLAPLAWLLAVTMTAGWMKIFSADPRLGFLSAAASYKEKIVAGGSAAELDQWQRLVFSNHVNAGVTGTFLVLVAIVVVANARVWWRLLAGKPAPGLHEERYVPVVEPEPVAVAGG